MLLLMFPSDLVCSCMMLASLGGGVSNTFDDWMGYHFVMPLSFMMLLWWIDLCFFCGNFLGDIT